MKFRLSFLTIFFMVIFFSNQTKGQFQVINGGTTTDQYSPGHLYVHGLNNFDPNNPLSTNGPVYLGKGTGGNGSTCTAVGVGALYTGCGTANTAIGFGALHRMVSGANQSTNNVAIGSYVMSNNTIGSSNTAIGASALRGQTGASGSNNVAIGLQTMLDNTTGSNNVCMGIYSLLRNTSGASNVALGAQSMKFSTQGWSNVAIGYNSMSGVDVADMVAGANTAVGTASLGSLRNGIQNVAIGNGAMTFFQYGNNNLAIGNGATLPSGNGASGNFVSNEISIQNTIMGRNANGTVGMGYISIGRTPAVIAGSSVASLNNGTSYARLHLAGSTTIPSLRLDHVPSVATIPVQNLGGSTGNYLFVDPAGIVCQAPLPAAQGGTINNCSTVGQVPRVHPDGTSLTCSQIYDNGTSVGIGNYNSTSDFSYTYTGNSDWHDGNNNPTTGSTGNFKLAVDGMIKSVAYYAISDARYKLNIKTLDKAVDRVKLLRGVSYNWNSEKFPDLNFSNVPQIGFIAQEVEKVLPQAVVRNKEGFYSMNYQSLIPVLTEAIKEQQTEIESLKTELDDLKAQVQKLSNAPVVTESDMFTINPNPVTGISVVDFTLTKPAAQVQFAIYDLQGKQLKLIPVVNPQGKGQISINKNDLGKGMYILTLIGGGQELQSKKFVILD